MDFNTARVVIDLRHDVKFHVDTPIATNHVRVALSGGAAAPVAPMPVPKPPVVAARPNTGDEAPNTGDEAPNTGDETPGNALPALPTAPAVAAAPQPAAPGGPLRITSIAVNPLSDTVTQVIIKATGPARYRTVSLTGPNRLALDLAGAGLQEGLQDITSSNGDVVNAVRAGIIHAGQADFGRVVIDLSKAVDYSITTQAGPDGTTYLVNLETGRRLASNPNGPLRGKIIMVDPGHGGGDSGAVGIGGAKEKDLTLEIGKRLSDVLRRNGATVYMTRDGDTLPSVRARPQMAISVNADYFISVHCDESGPANSHSGTTVYYHAHNPVCRRLAADISKQVAQVCAIPALGTKSDTIRFQTGFGVLRGSPMPAVLVETGYMNSARDLAKLVDPAVQQNIAEGIVAGLIDFVAERGGE
jgi:N-acetylmuramoyl-L-alanine amidase